MIRAHKLRAFFTVLGTVVGVTFLIATITLINGMDAYMREDLGRKVVGLNTVTLRRTPPLSGGASDAERRARRRNPPITFADAEWLAGQMRTPGVLSYGVEGSGKVHGPRGRVLDNVRVRATSPGYFRAQDLPVAEGRLFSDTEAERGMPVLVVGRKVADQLFPEGGALGRDVSLWGIPYRIIGVLEEQGTVLGFSFDQVAVAPARSPLNGVLAPRNVAGEVTFRAAEEALVAGARAEMAALMRVRHGLRPHQRDDFSVTTSDEVMGAWGQITRVMLVALPGLVGISLLVGAVVIMNILLVSVTQRTREIGLRKSLGARRRDILAQFLTEAVTLSGGGGVAGILAGVALAALVAAFSPIPARVAPWSLGLAMLLSVGVGVAAGVYPALRAARMDPIVALRRE